ncbi:MULTISPECIES: CU044_2847 family protein [Actinomadura]|uniref:CU044_2847 family protein n=1 Tax=Actinomadura yumaensis TaxID=111807 RepID=A0ABW2C9C1_9ACTN|nr:CU044_2847 family protein [Actinomadura sp. J1-007]MWK33863.1 hypothetical protein [Actinomadura sp. J1-007]
MAELVRWETDRGPVVVETDELEPGFRSVARSGETIAREARVKFEDALQSVRDVALSALATFRDGDLRPDGVELEFSVKLNAEAGAVIAKTSVEGQLRVRLSWGETRPDGS